MGNFNIPKKDALKKAEELLMLFLDDKSTGIDWSECVKKLKSMIEANDSEIKIALMGAFSDGKTSTIAALMGEVMDDMQMDVDESSDQLQYYRPKSLKNGFLIVDTPGLFGTKEKEIDGKSVKFSKQTESFISEADIILYVTDAIVPVKDSHKDIMKTVLRTYNKLDSTIFVLNKMDAIVNPTDDEAYENMSLIKRNALIERLKEIISLTSDEAKRLRCVCISADPKEKGFEYWSENIDKYNRLSRIPQLWSQVNGLTNSVDKTELKYDSAIASLKQVVYQLSYLYLSTITPLEKTKDSLKEDFNAMELALNQVAVGLKKNKVQLREALIKEKDSVLNDINNAGFETLGEVIERDLGIQGKQITYYVLREKIDGILESYAEQNGSSLETAQSELKGHFEKQDDTMKNLAKGGLVAAKNIGAKNVLAVRDMFFKSYKFKPWGATKLAGKIGKVAGIAGLALQALDIFMQFKHKKELDKAKENLKTEINNYFASIFALMKDDDTYFQNFAPSFSDMKEAVNERKQSLVELMHKVDKLESFKKKLDNWYGFDIEDVEFEEI